MIIDKHKLYDYPACYVKAYHYEYRIKDDISIIKGFNKKSSADEYVLRYYEKCYEKFPCFKKKNDENHKNALEANLYKILEELGDETLPEEEIPYYSVELDEKIMSYLEDGDAHVKVQSLTKEKLKDLLRRNKLKVSGRKAELLERVFENIPAEKLERDDTLPIFYKVSKKGKDFLKDKYFWSFYLKITDIEGDPLNYFLTPNQYVDLKDEMTDENRYEIILNYLNNCKFTNLNEYLIRLFAYARVYNLKEDFENLLKTAIKISLIYINHWIDGDCPVLFLNIRKDVYYDEYIVSSITENYQTILDLFCTLIDSNTILDKLEDFIMESYEEIKEFLPKLTEKSSIYYLLEYYTMDELRHEFRVKDFNPEEDGELISLVHAKRRVKFSLDYYSYLNGIQKGHRKDFTEDNVYFNKAVDDGFIKVKAPIHSLNNYNAIDLINLLLPYGFSGRNNREYIKNFVMENFSDEEIVKIFPLRDYELTVEGENFLKNNRHYYFGKQKFYKYFSIGSTDDGIVPLSYYEKELHNLENLAIYIKENTLKDDLSNENWDEYANHLDLLRILEALDGNNKEALKLFYEYYLIKLNAWYKKDEFNFDNYLNNFNQNCYRLHIDKDFYYQNYYMLKRDKDLFHEVYSSMKVPALLFTEDESFSYLDEYHSNSELIEELKKRIHKYKTGETLNTQDKGETLNTQEKVLYDEWLEAVIYYRSEEGSDDFDVQFIKEQMGLDFFYESEKDDLKVNEFLIKTDELLSQNFTKEEIEEELKDYIDFLNTEGLKEIKRLTDEYNQREALTSKMVKNNLKGRQLEREGKTDEAIELYEENLHHDFEGDFPYERLAIIYRKRRDYPNEIRVCEKYIKIATKEWGHTNKVEKFEKRLEKAKKLKETYYYLFTD